MGHCVVEPFGNSIENWWLWNAFQPHSCIGGKTLR